MPTTSIIGYLWSQRQDLDLRTTTDALQLAADITHTGVVVVTLREERLFGKTTGHVYTQWVQREPREWAVIVEGAIMDAAIEHTIDMLHSPEEGDSA